MLLWLLAAQLGSLTRATHLLKKRDDSVSPVKPKSQDGDNSTVAGAIPYGSGSFGRWKDDESGMPSYQLRADARVPNSWSSGIQLGNDRFVALVNGDGSLAVRQDEGSPKLLTGGDGRGAGLGYLQSSPTPFISGAVNLVSTCWPLNITLASAFPTDPPNLTREFGVGFVRKVATTSDIRLEQVLIAPYGDDPVIVSEVTITNTGNTVWDTWYTEAWPTQWKHLEYFHEMARQAHSTVSSFLDPTAFAADPRHYSVTSEKLEGGAGVAEHRRWLGLTAEETAEQRRINQVLDASNNTIGGLPPHSQNASVWDQTPPSVWLVSLDGPADRVGNDGAAFFGSGGASAPTMLVNQADEGSADRHLPWNTTITGNRSALLLARNIKMLRPGSSVKFRFLWGYQPDGAPGLSAARDRLIAKYKAKHNLLASNAEAWKTSSVQFATDEPSMEWLSRELIWHNYMLRAGTTYDDFFNEFTVNQATGYLYADGLNAAARDPLQHVLPLIATAPKIARGVIRTTLKEMVKPESWPRGFQSDLLPYSLMSHGLVWPDRERGPSDLDLYVLLTASEYVLETKDTEFLSEKIRTYTLFGGDGTEMTIMECLLACFEHLVGPQIGLGQHGLLRMLTSDWSDVIYHDRAGLIYGSPEWFEAVRSGESVMNSTLAAYILPRFGRVLDMVNHTHAADNVTAFGKAQAEALRRFAWTGEWFKRAFVDESTQWIGDATDQIETGPQPWAVLAGVLESWTEEQKLLAAVQARLRADAPFGAKQLERGYNTSTDDLVGVSENGGVWFALNYPLAWALNRINRSVGLEEFKRNSMAVHAELFPEQMNGIWTASDWSVSTLAANHNSVGTTGTLCMHRHAWPLYAAMRILGGVEFSSRGIELSPHPAVAMGGRFMLRTPLFSVEHDGSGRWYGYYAPHGVVGDTRVEDEGWSLRLRLPDGREKIIVLAPNASNSTSRRFDWTWIDDLV